MAGPRYFPVRSASTTFFRYPWSEIDQIEIAYPKNFDLDNAETPAEVADPKRIGASSIKIRADKVNAVRRMTESSTLAAAAMCCSGRIFTGP